MKINFLPVVLIGIMLSMGFASALNVNIDESINEKLGQVNADVDTSAYGYNTTGVGVNVVDQGDVQITQGDTTADIGAGGEVAITGSEPVYVNIDSAGYVAPGIIVTTDRAGVAQQVTADQIKVGGGQLLIETSGEKTITANTVKINIDENDVTVTRNNNIITMTDAGVSVQSGETMKIEAGKISVETTSGPVQVKVLPSQVAAKEEIKGQVIKNIVLETKGSSVVYKVEGKKPAKILFFIQTELDITTSVDASTGVVVAVNRPWWSFLAF